MSTRIIILRNLRTDRLILEQMELATRAGKQIDEEGLLTNVHLPDIPISAEYRHELVRHRLAGLIGAGYLEATDEGVLRIGVMARSAPVVMEGADLV